MYERFFDGVEPVGNHGNNQGLVGRLVGLDAAGQGVGQIKDIQFSKECKVENGTLYVDPDAVKAFMYEDDDVKAMMVVRLRLASTP